MSAPPRVSVAICTYNGEPYVAEQLRSIAEQKLAPAEIVVSDDASSDHTIDVIEHVARSMRSELRIHRNGRTLGAAANFDLAIGLCRGDYIALADQDDVWLPHKLARLLEALLVSDAGFAFSDAVLIDAAGRDLGGKTLLARRFTLRSIDESFRRGHEAALLLKRDFIYGTTMMVRAADVPLFRPVPEHWSHDTWIANMLTFQARPGIPVLEPLVRYRQHRVQASGGTASPRRIGYPERVAAYEALRGRLAASPHTVRGALDRVDEKLRYLRALASLAEAAPPRRAAIAARELLSGRWWRYSPRTLLVDKRGLRRVRPI